MEEAVNRAEAPTPAKPAQAVPPGEVQLGVSCDMEKEWVTIQLPAGHNSAGFDPIQTFHLIEKLSAYANCVLAVGRLRRFHPEAYERMQSMFLPSPEEQRKYAESMLEVLGRDQARGKET